MDPLERLTRFSQEALAKLRVRSALNPCLWLCAITLPFGFALAMFGPRDLYLLASLLVLGPIGVFALAFTYLVIKDPDKLRSEDYELRKMALGLIEEKGGSLPLTEVSVEVIANPDGRALPKGVQE